jgi:hypothetical protein
MLKKLLLVLITNISLYALHYGEVNLNNADLELSAQFDIGQFNDNVEPDTIFVGGKFFYADKKHSDGFLPSVVDGNSTDSNTTSGTDIDPYFELNVLMMKQIGNRGMYFGMGAKLNFTKNYFSVPLGVEFKYIIPAKELIPMYIHGSIYYAPGVLSFKDASDFFEYRISYDVEVIDNGFLTLGYRGIDTNYELGDFTYNQSWFIGFRVGF